MISNSTISNSVFRYNALKLLISNATIERCLFQGIINDATITGNLTKCQFEGLSNGITINGPLNDMTIQTDITPSSASYVLNAANPSLLNEILELIISTLVVPRLADTLHKDCYIATINPGNKVTFMVQVPTDDTNPRGIILMFFPGTIEAGKTLRDVIPKGYALCDGGEYNGVVTPNLQGRFIRAAIDENDVGVHDNSSLLTGDSGRKDSIEIKADNLPPHQHTFKLESATFTHNLKADRFEGSRSGTYTSAYSCNGGSIKGGEGSEADIPGVCNDSTASVSIDISHEHTVSGDITLLSATVKLDLTLESFDNKPINIEPNAYALVFIMKL